MKGDYFSWLSHDDLYFPNHLEKHIEYLRIHENEKIITFSNFNIIDENSNEKYRETLSCGLYCYNFKLNKIKPEYSLLQGEINGGSVLIPRKAFEKCGLFNEKLLCSQEREMWARLMKYYTFANIPYITNSIREHKSRVTNTNPKILDESNKTRLEIIESLEKETMNRLEGNVYNFYQSMEEYFKRQGLNYMKEEMTKKRKKSY